MLGDEDLDPDVPSVTTSPSHLRLSQQGTNLRVANWVANYARKNTHEMEAKGSEIKGSCVRDGTKPETGKLKKKNRYQSSM
jgi:hypothetical protein